MCGIDVFYAWFHFRILPRFKGAHNDVCIRWIGDDRDDLRPLPQSQNPLLILILYKYNENHQTRTEIFAIGAGTPADALQAGLDLAQGGTKKVAIFDPVFQ